MWPSAFTKRRNLRLIQFVYANNKQTEIEIETEEKGEKGGTVSGGGRGQQFVAVTWPG